jgi:hypothetical protein
MGASARTDFGASVASELFTKRSPFDVKKLRNEK